MVHLHSSLPHDASSGWNFRSSEKLLTLRCDSQSLVTTLGDTEQIHRQWDDPLDALEWMAKQIRTQADARWVGYISYDLGRLFEALPSTATDDLKLPLFCFSLYRNDPTGGVGHLQEVSGGKSASLVSSFSRDEFLSSVRCAIDYIGAGDIFQVNLSQRFSTALKVTPATVWENLLSQYPAAYGAFLDASDHVVISNSPELFIKVDTGRRIITRPIKGTRPNQPGMDAELRDSPKDQAELNMIVDLERNDLGRICQVGSVRVTTPRTIEMHPTVFHGVATIEGVLREEVGFVDLLRQHSPVGLSRARPRSGRCRLSNSWSRSVAVLIAEPSAIWRAMERCSSTSPSAR